MNNISMNNNGVTAIYVRRSVADRDNNSLSIESQKEDCIRYIGADTIYRLYCDNGYSGKDVDHRPAFQQMMQDARDGIISRIIVKKYDRFSRNLRDYLNVTDELDSLGVSVYSLSEPFNTSTKEGRLMRNNLLTFAEFERETIAARVADAYDTRGRETGFYQGGNMNFGYIPERMTVNGKKGSVLVPNEQAYALKLAYQMYAQPSTSLRNIIVYFKEHADEVKYIRTDKYGVKRGAGNSILNISTLSALLSNPLYVRADKNVYAFLKSKGYEVLDDVEAYDGVHGVFLHSDGKGGKYVKVGYHEGLVSSEVWLTVQDKKSRNISVPKNSKVQNSWLVGLVKCAHCGYSVTFDKHISRNKKKMHRYLVDYGWITTKGCIKRSFGLHAPELEETVLREMREHIEKLRISKKYNDEHDPEIELLENEIIRIEDDIRSLTDKLIGADNVVFDYIQKRIKELHTQKNELERQKHTKLRKRKSVSIKPLSEPLKRWDSLSVQEQHELAAAMIDVIYLNHENDNIEIHFSI